MKSSGLSLLAVYLLLAGVPTAAPAVAVTLANSGDAPVLTYLGNEGFLLEHGGKKVLIDALFDQAAPFLGPSPEVIADLAAARGSCSDVDLVLVTHFHSDHFDPGLTVAHLRSNPRGRLVAPRDVVERLRRNEHFSQINDRVHPLDLAPGAREQLTLNGIAVAGVGLAHKSFYVDGRNAQESVSNLAFAFDLAGVRFLHFGDATIGENLAQLRTFPFDAQPVDVLFLGYLDRSREAQRFTAGVIKPNRIVAMHVPPAEWTEQFKKVREAYPYAILFKESSERRSLPIEVDLHALSGNYLGQTPPGATPVPFATGIVSTDANEHSAPAFSPDGNEVFWFANRPPGPERNEWSSFSVTLRRENGRWSAPSVSPFDGMLVFSVDGRQAYFSSQNDLWVVEKHDTRWGEPRSLGLVARFPELKAVYMPTVTRTGTLYFLGSAPAPRQGMGIYRAELAGGEYAKPQFLPGSINLAPSLNWAPFIAPDESFLLFSSGRDGSLDKSGDIYVSRRLADGSWTDPVSLGEPVNTRRQEVFPGLSPDGKYLFFARDTPNRQNDIYWVEAASIAALRDLIAPTSK